MGDALSVPFIVSWISTIVKIPIETTNRIEALALLYKQFLCVSLFSCHFPLSQTPKPNMRHMQTFYSYYSNNLNLLNASPMNPT